MDTIKIDQLFKSYFPALNEEFQLKDFQKSVISNVVDGKSTLCIMPTGGGKSLIYWLSGLAMEGITIVISPLIALIDEQSEKIREQGYEVLTIHGGINAKKQVDLLTKFSIRELNPNFIFVSPERISTDGFFEYCIKTRKEDIKLIAIDEVHCVSQWGVSFRPFYKRIPVFLNEIYGADSWGPKILALTATLNSKEVIDVCDEFKISKENIIKDEQLMRTEIKLKVLKFTNENEKEEKFWDLLDIHRDEKVLVYLYRKYHQRGVEDLTEMATEKGYKAVAFHGDMSAPERQKIIRAYKDDEINVVFATNAFGMGIDIPDIRVVIHFMMPESVEQYYQEVGRAARDKGAANAYILYTNKNIQVKKTHFINKSFPSMEVLDTVFTKITGNQKKLKTLQYYDDDEVQKCLAYFLDNGLMSIECKGVSNLKILSDIQNDELKEVFDSTKTKSFIKSVSNTGKSPKQIVDLIFSSVANDKVKLVKNLDKCLIINTDYEQIPDDKKEELQQYINERKQYKHNLLDYFVYLLDEGNDSRQLHQEIGKYLGVPKHKLNRIYATSKGDKVRSKSEVIIANLLYEHNVDYEYEKKLYYSPNNWVEPDFTIKMKDGREIYWEHLGMIGVESYDKRWKEKLEIYRTHFPNQLEVTYEGTMISDSTKKMLEKLELI
ncbi:RecQ family ATP-dependent DNA helicase [Cytobacillus sp. FSL R7-0680]|uniref:RecQ family ATP-dependent DNA helicase n=1 Tax=Cytobacillus sp. FSL R7-0680 TaxID=2921689 RepID=UPI0030F8F532